jgi:hypothetical protein
MKPSLVIALCVLGGFSAAEAQPSMERIQCLSRYHVQRYANIYGVPANFVEAIIQAESNWRLDALSPEGAAGLMQLMPATARRFGVRNVFNIESADEDIQRRFKTGHSRLFRWRRSHLGARARLRLSGGFQVR